MKSNYYRVPTEEEMEIKMHLLRSRISEIELSSSSVFNEFRFSHRGNSWEELSLNPWEEFLKDTKIHIGKRKVGWVFYWNHNDWKYFGKSKEELYNFLRSGLIVNCKGEEIPHEEFISMAEGWGQPDGMTNQKYFEIESKQKMLYSQNFKDILVEGLRFMNHTKFE